MGSLDRYSVEAEKYRGYMTGHHNLYAPAPASVDPVTAAAAAAKYLESSGKSNFGAESGAQKSSSGFLPELGSKSPESGYSNANNNKAYGEAAGNGDGSAAAKAYLETAKLYMDSKNYAAEVQRAYMDAAAKSIYGEGKPHDAHNSSTNSDGSGASSMDSGVKSERGDGATPPNIHSSPSPFSNPSALANYYSQAAAAVAGQAANPNAAAALSGIVPLSLSQYGTAPGSYPASGEYRRPLPVIF